MTERRLFPSKRPGCCICCSTEVYTVHARDDDGRPTRLGPMLETGCQVEFLMSDGSEADIACCVDCARTLAPEDYLPLWRGVVDANARALAHRPKNEQRRLLAASMRVWPVALKLCRREDQAAGRLVVDRRPLQ